MRICQLKKLEALCYKIPAIAILNPARACAYDRLLSWAEIYDTGSFESKKMFVSQFVKSVRVYRDYNLEIEFNVSFDEFKEFRRTGQSGDRSA